VDLAGEGIIERNTDLDFFSFSMASGGNPHIVIEPFPLRPNLDILARLYDSNGVLLHESNPSESLSAGFEVSLPAGDYFLSIDGTGWGDPLGATPTGYTDYGSLGYYSIKGSFSSPTPTPIPIIVVSRDPVSGGARVSWTIEGGAAEWELQSSTNLLGWGPIRAEHIQIEPAPTGRLHLTGLDARSRFYRLSKSFTPLTVFSENFDGATSPSLPLGWTMGASALVDAGTTAWQLGIPTSVGPSESQSPINCLATNIGSAYGSDTDIWLRTPPIDLTAYPAATLQFSEFKEIENVPGEDLDFGTIRILAADDLAELAVLEPAVEGASSAWEDYAEALPSEAFDESIVIEFQFQSDAADLHLQNAGFEKPTRANGHFGSAPGWVEGRYDLASPGTWISGAVGDAGNWNPDAADGFSDGAAWAGQNSGWAISHTETDVGLSQVLNTTLQAETTYVLSLQIGNAFYNESDVTADYRIELLAGGVILQSDTGPAPAADTWELQSLTFNSGTSPAQLGQPLEIRLLAVSYTTPAGDDGYEVDFDDVNLVITPAPASNVFAGWYLDDVMVTVPGS
jgi:hypothetical protein